MTRNFKKNKPEAGHWILQDAKSRFSELVRLARTVGPQHVSLHGKDVVVVISEEEFRQLKGELLGDVLIEAMQQSPHKELEIEPSREVMPVRNIEL